MAFKLATQRRSSTRASSPIMRTSSRLRRPQMPTETLQRAIGNSATAQLFRTALVQPKLTISEPGDMYEREADRKADEVMRMPDATVARSCGCNGCSGCKDANTAARTIQPLSASPHDHTGASAPPAVDGALRSPGRSLDAGTRAFFEPRFGHDFRDVRVHTGGASAASAQELHAQAYTVGREIVFRSSEYSPNTTSGRRLLAHELTHVVQQARGSGVNRLMPYRHKSAANFGKCNSGTLVEKQLSSRKTDPWISNITINFDSTTLDSAGALVPKGKLTATYSSNPAKMTDISADVVGGKASEGLTDRSDTHKVTRIEGCGYHHLSVPKAQQIDKHPRAGKYFKPSDRASATMNYAVFFLEGEGTGNQAIHEGSLSSGSLACVHVGTEDTIRQINFHSVKDHTNVKVSYDATPLAELCCARHKVKKRMVSNPCGGQDAKKCP